MIIYLCLNVLCKSLNFFIFANKCMFIDANTHFINSASLYPTRSMCHHYPNIHSFYSSKLGNCKVFVCTEYTKNESKEDWRINLDLLARTP